MDAELSYNAHCRDDIFIALATNNNSIYLASLSHHTNMHASRFHCLSASLSFYALSSSPPVFIILSKQKANLCIAKYFLIKFHTQTHTKLSVSGSGKLWRGQSCQLIVIFFGGPTYLKTFWAKQSRRNSAEEAVSRVKSSWGVGNSEHFIGLQFAAAAFFFFVGTKRSVISDSLQRVPNTIIVSVSFPFPFDGVLINFTLAEHKSKIMQNIFSTFHSIASQAKKCIQCCVMSSLMAYKK